MVTRSWIESMEAPILSYVLPFYRRAELFRRALSVSPHYRSPYCELVLVLDDPVDELPVLKIVRDNPDVKFRVIVNDVAHCWRSPCIPINVGVKRALGDSIAILSPETVLDLPRSTYLDTKSTLNDCDARGGLTWHVQNINPEVEWHEKYFWKCARRWQAEHAPVSFGFGFLMCRRASFLNCGGMDESRVSYGHDDDCIRYRLIRNGTRFVIDGNIEVLHMAHERTHDSFRPENWQQPTPKLKLDQPNAASEFSRIAFDWKHK